MTTPARAELRHRGHRDARRCLIASVLLLLAIVVESQFHDPALPLPSLMLLGALTVGAWCAATLAALVLYLVIFSAWLTSKNRARRYR